MCRRASRASPTACMCATRSWSSNWSFSTPAADYLQKLLPTGQRRLVSGKVELFDGIAQMVHPDHVLRAGGGRRDPGRMSRSIRLPLA